MKTLGDDITEHIYIFQTIQCFLQLLMEHNGATSGLKVLRMLRCQLAEFVCMIQSGILQSLGATNKQETCARMSSKASWNETRTCFSEWPLLAI